MLVRIHRYFDRKINTFFYRLKYGSPTLLVGAGTQITCKNFSIGKHVQIDQNVIINGELSGHLIIGENSKINSFCKIDTTGTLYVGKNTVISEYTKIYTHGHGGDPYSAPRPYRLEIGDNVWIGANCLILPSIRKIKSNTIISAGSVLR